MGTLSITAFTDIVSVSRRASSDIDAGFWGSWEDGISFFGGSANLDLLNSVSGVLATEFPGGNFLAFVGGLTVQNGSIVFGFNQTDQIFVLDGGSPISFNELPAGFVISSLTLNFGTIGVSQGATPGAVATATMNGDTENFPDFNGIDIFTITIPLVVSPVTMTPTTFVGLTLTITISIPLQISDISVIDVENGMLFTGMYAIESTFNFLLDTPVNPAPGKTITLTTNPDDPDPMPIQDITQIIYTWNDGSDHTLIQTVFETQYPLLLIWLIPFGFGDFAGTVNISAFIESTEFSGSVPLGTMSILFEDASGIYKLVVGKKSDTLYDPARIGDTIDVKIPNPFARTGFIGG